MWGPVSLEGGHLSPAVCVSCAFVRLVSPHGFNDPRAHFQAGITDSWGAGWSQDTCHTTEWGQKKFQQYKGNELLNRPNMTFGVSLQYTLGSLGKKKNKPQCWAPLLPPQAPGKTNGFPLPRAEGQGALAGGPAWPSPPRGPGVSAAGRGGDPIRRVSCPLSATLLLPGSVGAYTPRSPREPRAPAEMLQPTRGGWKVLEGA